ncbi:MAG TPA: ABC transporter ATP-binding protein [Verrucomicrobiae bacterium]|jgi:NitT/TauT family transport system ATP-binding protein|nr:ABC transporter ATP-binding protein [Verrucomicrobiae bacterium]
MRVVIHGLTKTYTTGRRGEKKVRALGGVDLEVRDREFFGVIGPTGCGKTTLLHVLAGLEKATAGSVEFVGEKHTEAMVSMVFQDAALMPWRTVSNNVPLGPEFRKQPEPIYKRVSQFFLEMVRIVDFSGAHPGELSGGMKQKVAIARALANDPEVIVMDEPFANLDAQTRLLLREELLTIWEKHKKTVILVTHNIEEAVMLCDRVAVMSAAPGVVKSVVTIDLPRPRGIKSMSDPDFIRCLEKIWDLLRTEVDRAMRENHHSGPPEEAPPRRKSIFDWW